MPLHIVRDDLANMRADAVVLPSNAALQITGGAGEAVARIAGLDEVQAACDAIGGCAVGSVAITPAFNFPAKMMVHAVGPVWRGGHSGEVEALYSCIHNALAEAEQAGAQSVALPLISTGSFAFPPDIAIDIETRAIYDFLRESEADIWLVLYDRESMAAGRALFADIAEYIDDVYVGKHGMKRTRAAAGNWAYEEPLFEMGATGAFDDVTVDAMPMMAEPVCASAAPVGLAERLERLDESFAQTVLRLIDERNMSDVEVYKKANMSRQLFAKIRKDDDYRPTKKTACALVFALGLDLDDAEALLERAGFTLSHSSKFDIIVEYFLVHGIHDIFQVNEALFAYDQPILG